MTSPDWKTALSLLTEMGWAADEIESACETLNDACEDEAVEADSALELSPRHVERLLGDELTEQRPEIEQLAHDVLVSTLPDAELRTDALVALLPAVDPSSVVRVLDRLLEFPDFPTDEEAEKLAGQPLRGDQIVVGKRSWRAS